MSRSSVEIRKKKERRIVSTTVGYCFVIVLVVLLVMSNILTDNYKVLLQGERADAMQSVAVASSTAIGHTSISEGMSYPLPLFEYDEGKPYIVSVYTRTTDSFRLLYSSSDLTTEQYLSGVGNEYIKCYEQQEASFTKRIENGIEYVCAIAPIISQENTVSGILEIRMPFTDFTSSVNGMSLSWVFTIFSIAISMGIMIFELNLFVSTLSDGVIPNVPVLIIYGDNAIRFLSFFMAVGAVMPPIVLSSFIKENLQSDNSLLIHLLISVGIILYALGFYSFTSVRKVLKMKLTSRIALLTVTALGYLLLLISGISNNVIVTLLMMLPIAFCCGMPCDALRDYRINASKLGYKGYDDRRIHNLQFGSYILGASVGTVVAGICYERFGLLIVAILTGAILLLTSLGIIYFMKNNTPVKEPYLMLGKWFELVTDKYTGRFMLSSFTIIGVIVSFLLIFVPDFLESVGISLATTSFYYLLAAFSACFIATLVKSRYNHVLTSKVRVIIASTSALIGFAIFALMPTAKILCVTVVLLGLSLGIHDFYYLYVLLLLSTNRFKANLRKAAEVSVLAGFVLSAIVYASAIITYNIRMVFLVALIVFFLCGFIYPMSAFSNDVDDKDPTVKSHEKSKKTKKTREPIVPNEALYTEPEAVAPEQVQGEYIPDAQAYVNDPMMAYTEQTGYIPPEDVSAYYDDGGDNNGYVE